NPPHPKPDKLITAPCRLHHVLQSWPRHEREDPHLQAVKHPAEKRGDEDEPLIFAGGVPGDDRLRCFHWSVRIVRPGRRGKRQRNPGEAGSAAPSNRTTASKGAVRALERVGNVPQPPLVFARTAFPPSPRMPSQLDWRNLRQYNGRYARSSAESP